MDKRSEDKKDDNKPVERDPTTPGPTTGGMRSMGQQPGEPTLEEKLGVDAPPRNEAGKQHRDDPRMNQGGARQGPPPLLEKDADTDDATAPHAPDNRGSADRDLDNERPGGMSGGLPGATDRGN